MREGFQGRESDRERELSGAWRITGSAGDFSHRAERFLSSGSEVTLYSNEVRGDEGGGPGEGEAVVIMAGAERGGFFV